MTIDIEVISGKFFELFCPQLYTYAFDTNLTITEKGKKYSPKQFFKTSLIQIFLL